MNDIEKAAAKLRSSKKENKATRNRSAENSEFDLTRQDAANIIDAVYVGADEQRDPVGQHKRGVQNESPSSSIGAVDILADPQVNLSVSRSRNSTANGRHKSNLPVYQKSNFRQIAIPLKGLKDSGFITPDIRKNKLTEEYRRIKRPLLRNLDNPNIPTNRNLVMVTSAIEGEGKTFTSINLAMSLAKEKGRQVIFVDADVLKGSAGDKLGASRSDPGLIDVLSGAATDVRDVVQRTNVLNLWFIAAGNFDSHANELLASARMEQCIQDMTYMFEECIIVFDCPPILLTNEANELLYHAGQIVFVVAERQSNQKHVESALAQIDDSKYIGIVLNKSKNRQAIYSYGYN